jgi:TPR repeat protein
MKPFAKIAAWVAVTCAAAIIPWLVYKEEATQRRLVEIASVSRARADQGDAKAQYSLGVIYARGQGVPQDHAEAVRWYRKAADQGYAKAQFNLAFMYYQGKGVPQDYTQAVRWYRRAADRGDAIAQYYLGSSYAQGQGVSQDYAEAVRWYRKGAELGYANAQYGLGLMYYWGRGVPRDYSEAIRWYREAAKQGDTRARNALLSMYCAGRGVPLAGWTSLIVVILLALAILVVPRRRLGRAIWLPWAMCSAVCAALLVHELALSTLSLVVPAQGSFGPIWRVFGHALLIAILGGGSAICALAALRVAMLEAKRRRDPGRPPTPPQKQVSD